MRLLSTAGANALTRSHTVDVAVTAYAATLGAVARLPLVGGTVTIDATSQTRRTATISIASADLWPDDAFAILSPIGSEIAIHYGIVHSSAYTEWIPLIRGPITDVTRSLPSGNNSEAVQVTVSDRSAKVAEARFDQPTQTIAGATTVSEIARLITGVLDVVVVDLTGSTKVAPQIEMEKERWAEGVEKLADSIGAEVWCDPLGNFVIRNEPTVDDPVVWTFRADGTSILVNETDEYTRDLVYNRVVASGQRTDGTPPVFAVVSDTNPASPTYINGPFGVKTRFFASPLLTTVAQCQSAGTSLLARVTGRHLNVTLSNVTQPALEAGDVIRLVYDDRDEIHVIDTVTIPLTPSDVQQIKTRSLTLPEELGAG